MVTHEMGTQPKKHGWPLHVVFSENDEATRADVIVDVDGRHYHGWGRARRSPTDPDVPRIGEEIAAARALNSLALQLLAAAGEDIEDFEGHPVFVHV